MRVSATSTNTALRDAPAARRIGNGTFALSDGANAVSRSGAGHLQAVAGIDVLVALQGVEDQAERRRRAVRGGRSALDALDALKLGLLSGELDQPALNRLRAVAAELTAGTGDATLDQVLAEIDLRVQVELAKLTPR
jgi:hypothetical protein